MKPVLLLVDLQNDFLGAPGLEPAAAEIIRKAARLLAGARTGGIPVIHAMTSVDSAADNRMPHWKALGRWKCMRGTPGHEAPRELAPAEGERVVSKAFFSAFESAELAAALARAEADTLLVAGVHLHGCVRATVLDAYARGFAVWVAEDAVGSDDPLHAAVTRRYLDGRASRFAPVEELLALLSSGRGAPAAVVAGREMRRDRLEFLTHRSPRELSNRLFTVPLAGASEAAEAAAAASEAGRDWRGVPEQERARPLSRLADLLESAAATLGRELAMDVGKPVTQGEAEIRRAAALLRNAAAMRAAGVQGCGPGSALRRAPLGVVAVVTPWNNPIAIAWGKIAPALVFGNTVVWKPAPAGTRLALRTLELAREAGLPEGLVNLVAGDHRAAAAVMSDPGVNAVSLSGSSLAGWTAQEICSRRRIPLQAELGGNNAAIVWEGADLSSAAGQLARGAFCFAGQRCTANRRAVVHAGFFDEFLELLTRAVEALAWGDPLDAATEVGPLISEEACNRVAATVELASQGAGRVFAPHAASPLAGMLRATGAYYPPTVVVGAAHESEVVQEETFGPLLVLESAGDFEEALRLSNGVRQGLVAALFSGPGPWRERFGQDARAGVLKWDASTADADAFAPFGGWKFSGVGPPEHGPGDAEFYARLQAIYGGS
jgi:acyl-CoA reductase-like NAD-dependent aldehyde dehydrogenase/nicotinamidase-related amidase